jgi:hypothetical protein
LVLQIAPYLTALLTEIPFKLIDKISLNVDIRAASLTLKSDESMSGHGTTTTHASQDKGVSL